MNFQLWCNTPLDFYFVIIANSLLAYAMHITFQGIKVSFLNEISLFPLIAIKSEKHRKWGEKIKLSKVLKIRKKINNKNLLHLDKHSHFNRTKWDIWKKKENKRKLNEKGKTLYNIKVKW